MFGADPFKPTGTDLALTGSKMMTGGGNGGGTTTMSPMESMKEVFLEIRDNTAKTVDLLTTLVLRDATQSKQAAIAAGNTDPDPGPKEKGPGILSRVMGGLKGAFSSLMPEKGGFMDTLLKIGLAVGGVALLKYFGDDMVPVLADLLKAIKEGKIGENIQAAYEYIKEIGIDAFEKVKTNTILFIDGVKTVAGLIKSAFNMVNDYVMSFDTTGAEHPAGAQHGMIDEGDGLLDEKELAALRQDIVTKITESVYGFLGNVGMTILKAIGIYSFGSAALTFLIKRAAVGAGVMAVGGSLLGVAAIAFLVAAGIYKLADNIMTAYDDAVTDELGKPQKFDATEFFARLLAGKDYGNTMANVINNAFDKMIIFAAGGALVGSAFPVVGTGIGALIGGLSGIVIGGLTAAMGAQALDDLTTDMFGVDSPTYKMFKFLYEAYELVLLKPFKVLMGWLGKTVDFAEKTNQFIESLPERLGYQLLDGSPLSKEDRYGENVNPDKLAVKSNAELLELQTQNQKNIEALPSDGTSIFGNPVYDTPNLNKFRQFKAINKALLKEMEKRELNPMGSGTDMDQFMLDKIENFKKNNKPLELTIPLPYDVGSSRAEGITVANNNNDSSVKVANETNLLGSLSQDNRHFTSLILAYKQSKLQTV